MTTTSRQEKNKSSRWFPLESNPTLLNSYISNLGFDTSCHKFYDVFSTEEWALSMIPQGAIAVLMLYPLTKAQLKYQKEEVEELKNIEEVASSSVWHMKQRIGNACGTIGVLHALGNIPESIHQAAIPSDTWLGKFYASCSEELDPVAKAEKLESNREIESMHDAATADSFNQTSRGSLEDNVETHFVAIVHVDGGLYELDGRKGRPIKHGDSTAECFLRDACKVVEKFMKRDPDEIRFTIMALCPAENQIGN